MIRLLPLFAFVVSFLPAEEGWVWKPPEIKAAVIAKDAPKIDGDLSDEAWKSAASSNQFLLSDGRKPKSNTKLMVLRDEKMLYIAVECAETEEHMKKLEAKVARRDVDDIWSDDCVELFLDPSGKRVSYYQLIINSKGALWDAWHSEAANPDKTWQSKAAVAAKVGPSGWSLEVGLPLSAFDRAAEQQAAWAFNVSRLRRPGAELVYWSPVFNDTSHAPEQFGILTGMPEKK